MAIRFNKITHSFVKTMTDSVTVYVDGVGPVTLKHSNRVEKTTLSATPDNRFPKPINSRYHNHRLSEQFTGLVGH